MSHTAPMLYIFVNTCTSISIFVWLCVVGGLWGSSVQSIRHSHVPGWSGQLGRWLCPQKQTWHLLNSHQIPWLDQRKDRSLGNCEKVKQDQRYGHEHVLMSRAIVHIVASVKHLTDFPADAVETARRAIRFFFYCPPQFYKAKVDEMNLNVNKRGFLFVIFVCF